jgi:hypothetical protein
VTWPSTGPVDQRESSIDGRAISMNAAGEAHEPANVRLKPRVAASRRAHRACGCIGLPNCSDSPATQIGNSSTVVNPRESYSGLPGGVAIR